MDNYYNILGLDENTRYNIDSTLIRKRYLQLCKLRHPDSGGSKEAFWKLNQAYQILSDPEKKAKFDKSLQQTEHRSTDWTKLNEEATKLGIDILKHVIRKIPVDILWTQDIVVTVSSSKQRTGKTIEIEYVAMRHEIRGSLVTFVPKQLKVAFLLSFCNEDEYIVLEKKGNEIVRGSEIVTGDLLVDIVAP